MRKKILSIVIALFFAVLVFTNAFFLICMAADAPPHVLLGGSGTVFDDSARSFSFPMTNVTQQNRLFFQVGDSFFTGNWVGAGASAAARDGLGPVFNQRSCAGCHFKDGRGSVPPAPHQLDSGLLVRLSAPGKSGGSVGLENYGDQLNHQALMGVKPEGKVEITYRTKRFTYPDNESVALKAPEYFFHDLAFGPFPEGTIASPRLAPAVIGLGLLEAVDETVLMEYADPEDKDHDGVSGRPNRVTDVNSGVAVMGRFGWKANQPNLPQQIAGAFLGDMGISSGMFPKENCMPVQAECLASPTGGSPEIEANIFGRVVLYSRLLAVPAQREWQDPEVEAGRQLFSEVKCDSCHRPQMMTSASAQHPELRNQLFHPYTDLLLHDMGEGLADHRPDFEASGAEWRTPPLWGLGLTVKVRRAGDGALADLMSGDLFLLHDGRAATFEEAILWHGGEAETSRKLFGNLAKEQRRRLLRFLGSL